jgi:pimeloyl-ACP methyl ester carboxylesterase
MAAGVVLAVAVAACSGGGAEEAGSGSGDDGRPGDDGTATSLAPYEGDDFYDVPDPLPDGEHGTLIRFEPVDDDGADQMTTWRVMYLSESVGGERIAVTGTVMIPEGDPPADGRELVTLAHGTTGIADDCAPSREGGGGESALSGLAAEQGYVLAMTDYEGLGTPGRHPYLVGVSEGRGVLDAALAARQLPDAHVGERFAIAGYSQGGHGALWAGQLAAEWAPELELVGTFAGAPGTELPLIFRAGGVTPITGFLFMIIAGFAEAYPDEADPSLVLTPEGTEALEAVDEGCVGDVIGEFGGQDASALLKPDLADVEPWATLAAENDPGRVATDTPILIIHSAADEVVPAALSELLFARMCGLGQQVERRVLDDGGGHVDAAAPAFVAAMAWIGDRFAGEPAASTCPGG